MDTATVTETGQITLPDAVVKSLNVAPGDQVAFVQTDLNRIEVMSQSEAALLEAQRKFKGAAEEAGWKDEDDVMAFIKEMRAEDRKAAA